MKTEVQTYSSDVSRIKMVKATQEELEQLEKDMDHFFNPKIDPMDMNKESRLRAEEELNENPNTVHDNIEKLRALIEADPQLVGRTDDVFLVAFLRGKKHDVNRAFQSYRNAYEMKARHPDFYNYLTEEDFPIIANQTHIGSLPGVDRQGRKILVFRPNEMDLNVPTTTSFKMGTGYLELMLSDLDIQVNGFVIIVDLKDLSVLHKARLVTPTLAWHLTSLLQDKMPMRVKLIHFVNQPFYFKALYTVFKPFLKKKLKKRVRVYGDNWEALHKEIAPENLPVEFGGTRPPFKTHLTMSILELNLHKFKEWTRFYFKKD